MTSPTIPAPDRDLQNADPVVPPAGEDLSPVTRVVLGSLAVAMGIALLVMAVVAALFGAAPLPGKFFNAQEINAALLAGVSAVCFIGCGVMIFRRSLLRTLIFFVVALLFGYAASLIG